MYPLEVLARLRAETLAAGLPVHIDGARVFHAAAALGVPVLDIAAFADSLTFCLSKGLGAPVGSVLTGDRDFVREARLARKALGGGMRQAGVLAAAGLVALEESPSHIPANHADANYLAREIAAMPGLAVDPDTVETNIVFFDVAATGLSARDFVARLAESSVLALALGPTRIRMVTHRDLDRADCERAVDAMRRVCAYVAGAP